jgi:hypothetical protein
MLFGLLHQNAYSSKNVLGFPAIGTNVPGFHKEHLQRHSFLILIEPSSGLLCDIEDDFKNTTKITGKIVFDLFNLLYHGNNLENCFVRSFSVLHELIPSPKTIILHSVFRL